MSKITYILFTNLSYVTVNDVRTSSFALALSDHPSPLSAHEMYRYRAVGYGPVCSWHVFDFMLPSIDYALDDKVLPQGHSTYNKTLSIPDTPNFDLCTEDHKRPIDVERFEFDDPPYTTFAAALAEKVAKYWCGPYMPSLLWDERAISGARNVLSARRH